jgi:hypothetical protein
MGRIVLILDCVYGAVGNDVNSSGTTVTLAEGWNGTEWAIQSTPNASGAS